MRSKYWGFLYSVKQPQQRFLEPRIKFSEATIGMEAEMHLSKGTQSDRSLYSSRAFLLPSQIPLRGRKDMGTTEKVLHIRGKKKWKVHGSNVRYAVTPTRIRTQGQEDERAAAEFWTC